MREEKQKRSLTETGYINKMVMGCHTGIAIILFAAYLVEWIKGSRSLGYTLMITLLTLGPVVGEQLFFRKNPEHEMIRHLCGIGYGVFYLFAIFTTNSLLTFTYAFPMFILITLFSDVRYCVLVGVGAAVGNTVAVVIHALTVGYQASEIPDVEIRVLCTALTAVYMVIATQANKKVNQYKLQAVNAQKEKTDEVLSRVLETSDRMTDGIVQVSKQMETLGESVEKIRSSMQEVAQGNNEAAESVQQQLSQTEAIQGHIVDVKESVQVIGDSMSDTLQMVEQGKSHITSLGEQVHKSMDANDQVQKRMEELVEYTGKMNVIIETITSVAESTNLLALNASIEAARAGEAGRGFAVVASEISGLANQTQEATVNITGMIGEIKRALSEVSVAMDVVTESNRANAGSTAVVAENFEKITSGTMNVNTQTAELEKIVKLLETANAEIVEKIQTISAITEEVSAHSSETFNTSEENSSLVQEVAGIVEKLNEDASLLKQMK